MKTPRLVVGVRMVFTLAVMVAGAVAGGCSSMEQGPPVVYRSEKHGYTITPPVAWEQQGHDVADVIFLCGKDRQSKDFRENINIIVDPLAREASADQYAKALTEQLAGTYPEYKVVSLTEMDLDGIQAKRLVATFTAHGRTIQSVTYIAVAGKTAYVITCTAIPESFATFEKMFDQSVQTFRVGKKAEEKAAEPYRSEKYGYSITPPASWSREGHPMADVIFFCPPDQRSSKVHENIIVGIVEQAEGIVLDGRLEEYAQAEIDSMAATFNAYRQISLSDIDLGNLKGKRLVLTFTMEGGKEIQTVVYITVKGSRSYNITCTATPESFAKFEKTFDDCAKTFRVE